MNKPLVFVFAAVLGTSLSFAQTTPAPATNTKSNSPASSTAKPASKTKKHHKASKSASKNTPATGTAATPAPSK